MFNFFNLLYCNKYYKFFFKFSKIIILKYYFLNTAILSLFKKICKLLKKIINKNLNKYRFIFFKFKTPKIFFKIKKNLNYEYAYKTFIASDIKFTKNKFIGFLNSGNVLINFLRNNNIYIKSKYSKSRAFCKTIVMFSLFLNIIVINELHSIYYNISINYGYFYIFFYFLIVIYAIYLLIKII